MINLLFQLAFSVFMLNLVTVGYPDDLPIIGGKALILLFIMTTVLSVVEIIGFIAESLGGVLY